MRDHPEEKAAVERITSLLTRAVENRQRAQGQLELGSKIGAARMWMHADKDISQLLGAIDEIEVYQTRVLAEGKVVQAGYRRDEEIILPGGLLFDVMLAVGLALYFNRGTTKRLKVLQDNTKRIAIEQHRGTTLNRRHKMAPMYQTIATMGWS